MMVFPKDETGKVLAEMQQEGIDLSVQHNVVFFVLFEQKEKALQMEQHIIEKISVIETKVLPDEIEGVWDLECTVKLIPSYQNIIDFETKLERFANKFSGYGDGWGIEA